MPAERNEVDQQIDKMSKLPILPQILLNLNKVAADDSASAEDLGQIILKDQALTMRVLKVVNSAYYRQHLEDKITTVTKAVVILGFNGVRRLTLGMSVYDMLHKTDQLPELRDFWSHSLVTAITARQLARRLGYSCVEEAFVAGLIHDIGKLVLANCDPPRYLDILQSSHTGSSLRVAEREVFGLSHTLAGKKLARRWGMPLELEEVIGCHHAYDSLELGPTVPALLRMVISANKFSSAILTSKYDKETLAQNQSLLQLIGLDPAEMKNLFTTIVRDYEDLAQVFEVDALPVVPVDQAFSADRPDVDHDVLLEQYHTLSSAVATTEGCDSLLARILDGTMTAVAIDRLFLVKTDPQNGRLTCLVSRGCATPEQEAAFDLPASRDGGIAGRTVTLQRAFHVLDAQAEEVNGKSDQILLAALGTGEFATLPIIWQSCSCGLLWLDNPHSGRPLTEPMLQAASTLANIIALVMGTRAESVSIS